MKYIYKLQFSDRAKKKHSLYVAENRVEELAQQNTCVTELNNLRKRAADKCPQPVSGKFMLNNLSVKIDVTALYESEPYHRDLLQCYSNFCCMLTLIGNQGLSEFFGVSEIGDLI